MQLSKKFQNACAAITLLALLTLSTAGAASQTPVPEEERSTGQGIVFLPLDDNQSGFINVELRPGEQAVLTVGLGNEGIEPLTAVTYAGDAYSLRNGGFGVRDFGDTQSGPTEWLDYPTEELRIEPNQLLERELTITVPDDTAPGEYVTALVLQAGETDHQTGGEFLADLSLIYRSAIGVRIEVPGEMQAEIEIGEPWFHNDQITYAVVVPVSNAGNLQMSPSGEITISNSDGELILTLPVQMGRVYGGHETEIRVGLAEPLPNGEYEISVVLQDESANVHAELPTTSLVVTGTEGQTLNEQKPVSFSSAAAAPSPAGDNVQFLQLDATIANTTEEPVTNAQLSLIATVNGEEVERFPISQSLSVPPGETEVSTRYIPLTGWTRGEWEFELLLETVEGSGAAVVVDRVPIEVKVIIP